MKHFKFKRNTVCNVLRSKDDAIVQNGLSITPAQMMELTKQGFSISAQNSRMLKEVKSDDFRHMDVPLEFRRGIDPLADGFQMQKEVHQKLRNAVNLAQTEKGD